MVDQTNKQYKQARPKVGLGVLIQKNGKFLLGKRTSRLSQGTWSLPGGHVEYAESWEECARRETTEEAGIQIGNLKHVATTNDLIDGKHYVTIFMLGEWKQGEAQLVEPESFSEWNWFTWEQLPSPLIPSLQTLVDQGFNPHTRTFDKLVRDKIIDIIEANDETAIYDIANEDEYKRRLQQKLMEEVYEYLESEDTKELADILEVINALASTHGISQEELEQLQQDKRKKRGGFEKGIILKETR